MLDWLKTILGDAYTEEIDKKVSEEIGKSFVAKKDFNDKNEALKIALKAISERDGQLETLKNSSGDVEALKQQIATLQTQNTTDKQNYEAQMLALKKDSAVENVLRNAGARNMVAVKALLNDFLKDSKLEEDGTIKGLSEAVETLKKGADSSFMFEGTKTPKLTGLKPGESIDNIEHEGKQVKDMSYDELCDFLNKNPDVKI